MKSLIEKFPEPSFLRSVDRENALAFTKKSNPPLTGEGILLICAPLFL